MNTHENARLTPSGRALLAERVSRGWTGQAAADAAGVSLRTARKWIGRHQRGGERKYHDRSSAPRRCPRKTSAERTAQIEGLRRQRMTGPAIAFTLGLPRSTVGAVLRRLGLGRLANLDPKPAVVRYERSLPGEMIHLDIKKLGRFDVEGHRVTGDRRKGSSRGAGWDFLHVCVDDASRLAYTEILPSERKEDTSAFLQRALAWLARRGIGVERVMTDNGSAYRSGLFRSAVAQAKARHIRTRPYTPKTNGKAERFIQTTLREWAYAQPYSSSAERAQALQPWTTAYNLTRPHTGIKGLTPWKRVNNLLGNDI